MSTQKEQKPKPPIPWRGYLFAGACGIIPILTLGGAIPGAIGVGGAAGCIAVARDPAKSIPARVGICASISGVCWILFVVLVVLVARKK